MNIYREISSNKWKSVFLFLIFVVIIVLLGYVFGLIFFNAYIGVIFAFLISIIMTLISYYSGDKIILSMSHAVPVKKEDNPYLVNTVEGLAIAAGLPVPAIYIIKDSALNAMATGRDAKHASIAVTSGAINKLNRTELEGVIAHEMSHIKNYDIRFMMLVALLVGIIALLSDLMLRSFIYGRRDSRGNQGAIYLVFIVIGLVLAILTPIIAQLIKFSISRKREFLADASGALLTRYPEGLANALMKIRDDKEPEVEVANKATAHLFIANPLRNIKGRLNVMFSTHPDINERIRRLEEM